GGPEGGAGGERLAGVESPGIPGQWRGAVSREVPKIQGGVSSPGKRAGARKGGRHENWRGEFATLRGASGELAPLPQDVSCHALTPREEARSPLRHAPAATPQRTERSLASARERPGQRPGGWDPPVLQRTGTAALHNRPAAERT